MSEAWTKERLRKRYVELGMAVPADLLEGNVAPAIKIPAVAPSLPEATLPVTLRAETYIPSKKNMMRPAGNKLVMDKDLREILRALVNLFQLQWHCAPLSGIRVHAHFTFPNQRRDGDGALVTVMDALKKAGVIVDDKVYHVKRGSWSYEVGEREGVVVRIRKARSVRMQEAA